MPRFPKGFGRRKSSGNVLEEMQHEHGGEPTFRVFERPDSADRSFDGGVKMKQPHGGRPTSSQLKDGREDNMFEALQGNNRDSGASHTNTISTGDQSSRRSATSTAPSSTTDLPAQDVEWKSPHDQPFTNIPPLRPSQGFLLRSAGRTLSFGRSKTASPTISKEESERTSHESESERTERQRAVTSSSYASTATPPRLDEREFGLNLGGTFGEMFSGFNKRESVADIDRQRGFTESPEIIPPGRSAGVRSNTISRVNQPSPIQLDLTSHVDASPYSWSSNHSGDGLMRNISPPPLPEKGPPPVPKHQDTRDLPSYGNPTARPQRPGGPIDAGLRRSSAFAGRRQSTLEYADVEDEDARLLRESLDASRHLDNPRVQAGVRKSWAKPLADVLFDKPGPSWQIEADAKPLARSPPPRASEESIAEAAILADQLITESPPSPKISRRPLPNRVMTPAQFERYREDQERLRSLGGGHENDENEDRYEDDEEDEDEAEKLKQVAKQRRKQEAHMAVYRQTMMKVTGEAPTRPVPMQSQSSPNLLVNGKSSDEEDEDDDVPLAILAAHGFPNKTRAPGQLQASGSHPNLRAASQMGAYPTPGSATEESVAAAPGGRLPVFARNLPQDPYIGAGLVNQTNREPLAYGGGAGSVRGGSTGPPPAIPGGLVGVIANEERARAMRRGSPNASGDYPPLPMPSPGGMGMGGQQMPMQMGVNGMPMGGMNPMMLSPGDQAQIQMTQQMQQFMQMQMQFMQMMTSQAQGNNMNNMQRPATPGSGLPRAATTGSMLGVPNSLLTPDVQPRPMSMMDPNSAPWMQAQQARSTMYAPSLHVPGAGYTPSIAPSERSNIGLPGRYRPVSQAPPTDKSRTSTMMSSGLNDWTDKNKSVASIKVVSATPRRSGLAVEDEEDDEEGWEEMKRKREKKKSAWKVKKGTSSSAGLKEMVNFAT